MPRSQTALQAIQPGRQPAEITRLHTATRHSRLEADLLFVYGTLRRDCGLHRHSLIAGLAEYVDHGQVRGRLFEVGGYPGIVESRRWDHRVRGEIYRLESPEEALPLLDDYERCTRDYPPPREYLRKVVKIECERRGPLRAWVYIYQHRTNNLPIIGHGDYARYLRTRRGTARRGQPFI